MYIMKPPYTCCRCGYETRRKDHMEKHLYKLFTQCPGATQDIELTDEIKEAIVKNRVYHPPPKPNNGVVYKQKELQEIFEVHKKIMDLIKVEEDFKNMVLDQMKRSMESLLLASQGPPQQGSKTS